MLLLVVFVVFVVVVFVVWFGPDHGNAGFDWMRRSAATVWLSKSIAGDEDVFVLMGCVDNRCVELEI